MQAKGEHAPTQEQIELQDEQQLENIDVVDDIQQPEYDEGSFIFYYLFIYLLLNYYFFIFFIFHLPWFIF